MFNLIQAAWRAWQAGQIIRSPAKWKSGAELTTQVTIIVSFIFTALVFFFPKIEEHLTTEMATLVGTIIIAVLGIVQIIIGRITTTKKVGLDVLLDDSKEQSTPGRRAEDRNIIPPKEPGRWAEDTTVSPPLERRLDSSKNVVPATKLGPGFRKVPGKGEDIL